MIDHVLIRYGELSLKKTNRKQFTNRIQHHIKRALKNYQNLTYESRGLRFYINLNNTPCDSIVEVLKKIPGIYSFSLVAKCKSNLDDIKALALEMVKEELLKGYKTFKIETNRGDKNFPMTSIEITKEIGRHLFRNIEGLKADVHNPDFVLDLDVRYEGTFIFTNTYMGLGGLPAGSLGKAMLMVSGGIDSVVSGYLAIKKGMTIDAIHFAAPPYTSDQAVQKVIDLLEVIAPYAEYLNINLYIVPFTKIQKAIYDNCRDDYCITIMRRMMYRITQQLATMHDAIAIINGESVGQVASQTLESMHTIGSVTTLPVLRPLATYDKQEIVDIATKINTYDISIRPYEDCCTVFVPRHPQIKPHLETAIHEENKFDYQSMIEEAVNKTPRIVIRSTEHYDYVLNNANIKNDDVEDLF